MEEVGTVRHRDPIRGPEYTICDADSASESLIQILSSAFESRTAGFRTLQPTLLAASSRPTTRNVNRSVTAAPTGDRNTAS